MTFKSANRYGFIFKTDKGEVKIKYDDHLKVTTYLCEIEGDLLSIHFERKDKKIILVSDRRLCQIPFSDIVALEVL